MNLNKLRSINIQPFDASSTVAPKVYRKKLALRIRETL